VSRAKANILAANPNGADAHPDVNRLLDSTSGVE
jgi:hypothetical protein